MKRKENKLKGKRINENKEEYMKKKEKELRGRGLNEKEEE